MSEKIISMSEIETWLDQETREILNPVQERAKQLVEEMRLALETEAEACRMLLDNSNKEIERRNMRVYGRARALNKLARLFLDRLKKVIVPEQVSYDVLNKFAQETQRVFIVEDVDLKNFFPRISPFFIIDRRKFLMVHEKAKLTLNSLNDFVSNEYVKTKTLEETFQLVKDVQALERQLAQVGVQKATVESERAPIEQEISELQRRISELEREGPVYQLKTLEVQKESLSSELKHELRHMQKPFIKVQALATQGGGAGLTPDELKKLNAYMEHPLEAIASEAHGYPILKEILQKLGNLIETDKLKLKADKARKATQSINEILNKNSLGGFQDKSFEVFGRWNELLASSRMDEIKRDISLFEGQLKQLTARKASIQTHESVKEHAETDIQERIRIYKRTIEKNVFSSLGKKIVLV